MTKENLDPLLRLADGNVVSCEFLFTGTKNALKLLLNIEQYEYMRGPQIDTGVKVQLPLLHVFKRKSAQDVQGKG